MKRILLIAASLLCFGLCASAQRWSFGTNAVDWVNLGTINAEAGVAVAQHVSLHASVRYNPWTFQKGDPKDRFTDPAGDSEKQFENRMQAYAFGLRYWPWYIYSGWSIYARAQYMEYNRGGLLRHTAEEGDAYGAGAGLMYTHLLGKNWNLELGAGVWGGMKTYTTYRCTNCGSVVDSGTKPFVWPDDIFVSFVYIF